MACQHVAGEGPVVGDAGLAHQRGVGGEAGDEGQARHLQHARLVGAVGEDLDAQVCDGGCHHSVSSARAAAERDDPPRGLRQVGHRVVGRAAVRLDCRAASIRKVVQPAAAPGADVAPAVADHEAPRAGRCRAPRGVQQQPGLRLAAGAAVGVVVVAASGSRRAAGSRSSRSLIASTASRVCVPAGHVGLVGDARSAASPRPRAGAQRLRHAGQDLELVEPSRGGCGTPSRTVVRLSTPSRSRKTARRRLSGTSTPTSSRRPAASGCDTSRCQTTAWNASACGVTCLGVDRRHDHAGVGHLRGVAAVAADDAAHRRARPPSRTAARARGSG